jgi:phosphorylated CTD-interacting factor 1
MMQYMVERMEEHLRFADSMSAAGKRCPLSFVIIVPSCSSKGSGNNLIQEFAAKSFRRMLRSKHFSKHIVLNAREHGYIEGSQHLRPTRFKESQYDTSAIVLQSKDAKEQEGNKVVGIEFEADLRKAFASRHQMELEERRNDSIIGNTVDEDTKVTEQEPEIEKKKSKKKRMKK